MFRHVPVLPRHIFLRGREEPMQGSKGCYEPGIASVAAVRSLGAMRIASRPDIFPVEVANSPCSLSGKLKNHFSDFSHSS